MNQDADFWHWNDSEAYVRNVPVKLRAGALPLIFDADFVGRRYFRPMLTDTGVFVPGFETVWIQAHIDTNTGPNAFNRQLTDFTSKHFLGSNNKMKVADWVYHLDKVNHKDVSLADPLCLSVDGASGMPFFFVRQGYGDNRKVVLMGLSS